MVISLILLIKHVFKKTHGYSIAVLLLFSTSLLAAQINVTIDRNPVALNESFQVIFNADESPDDDPDFSPLEKDFDILNQQKSSQLSWINGKTNKAITWTLNLMAKHNGSVTIPAISFGDDSSSPLAITVAKTTATDDVQLNEPLYLDVEVDKQTPYVQSQVLYTVRLYQRVNFSQASLTEPNLENTVVEKLGEDTQYKTQIKGVTYLVTERRYALFPQQSGPLTIEPMVLTAQVIIDDSHGRVNSFFNTPSTQTKRVSSKAISLNVQAAPNSFNGKHWLAADKLSLEQTWANNKDLQVNVGEPITRTITLIAQGTTSSQLPDLTGQTLAPQLKAYPDQAVINDRANSSGIIAMREQKVAIIPSKAGSFTLPAIEVPWFNTNTNKMEVATLPETTLMAINPTNTTPEDQPLPNSAATLQAVEKTPEPVQSTKIEPSPKQQNTYWQWLTILFAFAWVITLIMLIKARKKQITGTAESNDKKELNTKEAIKALQQSCADNDAKSAQLALLKWAASAYKVTSFSALQHYVDPALQAELVKLNHALYAKDKANWQGASLLQAVKNNQAKDRAVKDVDEHLAPLYPSQR